MSVAISPDGSTLATDMQGSIWTMPAAGGAMKRITDVFNDARQPMWSPDGRTIVFFAYRDGGYDIWAINPDGSNQRKLTWGTFDDREPIFSHDGTRIAFSSDRGNALGSDYNIWTLDLRNGELKQITKGAERRLHAELVAGRQRDRLRLVARQLRIALGDERAIDGRAARAHRQGRAARRAVVGPGRPAAVSRDRRQQTRFEIDGKPVTGTENVFAFRASWASTTEYLYVSDGKIRRRSVAGLPMQTVDFTATMPVIHPEYTHRVRDFTSTTPRKTLGIVRPVISPDGTQIAFAAVGDIYVMPVDGGARRQPHQGRRARHRSVVVARRRRRWSIRRTSDSPHLQLWIRDMKSGVRPQGHQHHDAAAGRVVLARRQAHRVLQRRRHVARRRDVDPRSRLRPASPRSTIRCRSPARRPGRPTASASRSPALRR